MRAGARGAAFVALLALASGGLLAAAPDLRPEEIYSSYGVLGLKFSVKARANAGKPVRILGYVAPPLKAEAPFFVLTRTAVAICPFCSSDADWPIDIVVVYPRNAASPMHGTDPVAVTGTLELGSKTDAGTGFVSQVRLVDAVVAPLK